MPRNALDQNAFADRTVTQPALARAIGAEAVEGWWSLEDRPGPLRDVWRQIREVSDTPLSVLIEGESGTGKELVCRAIHRLSARRDKPLVAVDCGAIPETLIESELFGYERGAFTGAVQRKPGQIQLAEGGTLFLDEVVNLPLAAQAKLLRALQERHLRPCPSGTVRSAARPTEM